MSTHVHAAPLGGGIFSRRFMVLVALAALAAVLILWRLASGLGATTGMNDGYPWGIWIAFDVVNGTALATGGYAMAILIYVLNKGEYHPLVRPAILTTALGYTIAGFSVVLDVGRWWNVWKVPLFYWNWNFGSALLEVALCVMAYMMVSWVEVGHSILEKWQREETHPTLRRLAKTLNPILELALPFVIAFGILLPTLHQSTLGTIFVISTKLHPYWHSQFLPLLFLVSCLGMGYSGVVLETSISHSAFKLKTDWEMLARLGKVIPVISAIWIGLRLLDALVLTSRAVPFDGYSVLFWVELTLFAAPAVVLLDEKRRRTPQLLFGSALMTIFGGALYRLDTYLVAFNPGPGWSYFPSIPELLITIGLVAAEIAVYIVVVRRFPILRSHAPASP